MNKVKVVRWVVVVRGEDGAVRRGREQWEQPLGGSGGSGAAYTRLYSCMGAPVH